MSKLDDVDSVDTLRIQTDSGESDLKIYANGLNQAVVQVFVKALTKDKKPIKSPDELIKGLALCFADDDNRKLSWLGTKDWTYTNVEGEYNGKPEGSKHGETLPSVGDDGTIIFKWFVSSTIAETIRIAVRLSTSKKTFSTADNSSGAERSSVPIAVMPAIDYSNAENLKINLGGLQTLSTDIGWGYYSNDDNWFATPQNGKCERRFVYLQPASKTNQTKFKKYEVDVLSNITAEDVRRNDVYYDNGKKGSFNLESKVRPFALLNRTLENREFQINMWFLRNKDMDISGDAYLYNSDDDYKFQLKMDIKDDAGVDHDGIQSLLLYKFSYPLKRKAEFQNWKSKVNEPTVKLTDFYGNEGSVKLTFNDSDNFDAPGIA